MILNSVLFRLDNLSIFVGIFIIFFFLLTVIYSIGFMRSKKGLFKYYLYILLTALASLGAVFANNLIVFLIFWGFLGLLLYLLIGMGGKEGSYQAAKKAFIIIGGTDAFMMLGIAFIWCMTGTFDIDKLSIALDNRFAVLAYLCLAAGAFAKAGAMPFHTWVPDVAEDAPTPVTAFLPASLDKLLGIYFLARITLDVFKMDAAMNTFLMVVGSVTIVAAVMMALVQHDFKRLLGYHAVSQVGYMILGIGTGNPVGIAGGLFHMLNNAVYKSCLFFSGGLVEKKVKSTDLDRIGALAKLMPLTFIVFLIASFSISGIPPFNGFVSKWLIYQGIIELGQDGSGLWVIWLVAAMFGSALTLASFMKLLHAIFLGQPSKERVILQDEDPSRNFTLAFPIVILAILCVLFGVFAYSVPFKMFIVPSINENIVVHGAWGARLAAIFIAVGALVGFIIYLFGSIGKARQSGIFIGGEMPGKYPEMRLSGTEFYETIQDIGILKFFYFLAKKKLFDLYEVVSKIALGVTRILRYIHNGILPTYLSWCVLGMLVLFYILLK